ncbi:MAG TPA: DUF433 domain-containing protein [Ktedonobacterales bacterium]
MRLEDYFDFSEAPDYIRIQGHRLGIEDVIRLYKNFASPEAIAQHFPGLSLEKIYATITYYLGHKDEVDAYIAELDRYTQEQARIAAQHPSPPAQRVRALKEQWRREGRLINS